MNDIQWVDFEILNTNTAAIRFFFAKMNGMFNNLLLLLLHEIVMVYGLVIGSQKHKLMILARTIISNRQE